MTGGFVQIMLSHIFVFLTMLKTRKESWLTGYFMITPLHPLWLGGNAPIPLLYKKSGEIVTQINPDPCTLDYGLLFGQGLPEQSINILNT